VTTVAAGSASAPAITTDGDTNTGIFFPAADTIAFAEGGAEAMRIDSSGNVGIGTTSPASRLTVAEATQPVMTFLRAGTIDGNGVIESIGNTGTVNSRIVFGAGGDNAMIFSTGSTIAERMRINSSGNVLIGGTTASSLGAGVTLLQLNGTNGSGIRLGTSSNETYIVGNSSTLEIATVGSQFINFVTNNANRMRITSDGSVGIGTTGPIKPLSVEITSARSATTDNEAIRVSYGTNSGVQQSVSIGFATGVSDTFPAAKIELLEFDAVDSRGSLLFYTRNSNSDAAPDERARITSGGDFLVGTTSTVSSKVVSFQTSTSDSCYLADFPASYTGSAVRVIGSATAGTEFKYFTGRTSGVDHVYIYGNGNIVNTNNSYGSISDAKLKENIVDASPKLSDVLQLQVRNFNFKINPTKKHIGFVAQEIEQVFPSLVEETPDQDEDGNSLETTTKSVKTSVLVPILVKAIQELKAELDTVKAELATLKGN